MKKLVFTLSLALLALAMQAQTKTHKNNLAAGGGIEQYNGDLGNSFFDFEEEWYGLARLAYSRYLGRSLDVQAYATIGEIGRCFDGVLRPEDPPVLMLRSRFKTLGLGLKYKFANGYLLNEDTRIAPFVYLGAALGHHEDVWTDEPRVNEGFYTSVNGAVGLSYQLTPKFQLVYNLNLGYFTSDATDFISKGVNDMYLQNTLSLAFNF